MHLLGKGVGVKKKSCYVTLKGNDRAPQKSKVREPLIRLAQINVEKSNSIENRNRKNCNL